MGKVKTNTLVGAPLNWAVASILGKKLVFFDAYFTRNGLASGTSQGRIDSMLYFQPLRGQWCCLNSIGGCVAIPNYCEDWNAGGPILAWHIFKLEDLGDFEWEATAKGGVVCRGASVLEAVCRAFVCSHMGTEIEIPEELCK